MAVSFVASSASGAAASGASIASTVPAGVQSGDVAIAFLESWQDSTPPTVTQPAGFTQKGAVWASSDAGAQNSVWWKRLTGADSGSYTFTLNATRWNTVQVLAFRGCAASGDPFDAVATPVGFTTTGVTSMSLTTTDANGALIFTVYNDNAGTHTPPTGFTEPASVDVDCAACAYKLGSTPGSQTISGASISASGPAGAWSAALLSTGGGAPAVVQPPTQFSRVPINRASLW